MRSPQRASLSAQSTPERPEHLSNRRLSGHVSVSHHCHGFGTRARVRSCRNIQRHQNRSSTQAHWETIRIGTAPEIPTRDDLDLRRRKSNSAPDRSANFCRHCLCRAADSAFRSRENLKLDRDLHLAEKLTRTPDNQRSGIHSPRTGASRHGRRRGT